MKREEQIRRIKNLTRKVGIILLNDKLSLSCGKTDIIQVDGVSEEIDGDWCLIGSFEDCKYCPTLTDKDVDKVFGACLSWASKVMRNEDEDEW